jgi:hypothetical protein
MADKSDHLTNDRETHLDRLVVSTLLDSWLWMGKPDVLTDSRWYRCRSLNRDERPDLLQSLLPDPLTRSRSSTDR